MLQKPRRRPEDEAGVTFLELLVVALLIGILAAIAIPSALGQREKARDAQAQSMVRTAQTAMESCARRDIGGYTACHVTVLKAIEPTLNDSSAALDDPSGLTAKAYTVGAMSSVGHDFTITRAPDGTMSRAATGGGSW